MVGFDLANFVLDHSANLDFYHDAVAALVCFQLAYFETTFVDGDSESYQKGVA